jgi:hypothetical protein
MKKALLLTGLFLCASGVYAEGKSIDTVAEGKKRNEEAYERILEQTGWKNETTPPIEKNDQQQTHEDTNRSSQSKSS